MKKLYNFKTWEKINESENSEILRIFTNMTKAIGILNPLSSLILLYVKIFGEKPTRVSLIFPKKGWETKAVNLLKKIGVVTGVFRSSVEAIEAIKTFKNKGIKVKELVIGSHGDGKNLLITQKDDKSNRKYATDLLKNAKDIITKETKVFFTACYGADYLFNLVDSANKLGVGVYGSRGIYNYVTNSAEKGYYYCNPYQIPVPKKLAEPRDVYYSGKLEMKISGFGDEDTLKIKFLGPFGKDIKLKMEFTVSSFTDLGWKIKNKNPLSFILKGKIREDLEDYATKDAKDIYVYEFYLTDSDFSWKEGLDDIGFSSLSKLLTSKSFEWDTKDRESFGSRLKKAIEKGSVKLILDDIDLSKERPKMRGYYINEIKFDNNEHLIKCGACKKVNDAPISWVSQDMF